MAIWIIGALFCWGFVCLTDRFEKEPWYWQIIMSIFIISLWPLMLGKIVYLRLEEKEKEK